MKAIPLSAGSAVKSLVKASRPPADAPSPTTGKLLSVSGTVFGKRLRPGRTVAAFDPRDFFAIFCFLFLAPHSGEARRTSVVQIQPRRDSGAFRRTSTCKRKRVKSRQMGWQDWRQLRRRRVQHGVTRGFQTGLVGCQFPFVCDDQKPCIFARPRPVITDRTGHFTPTLLRVSPKGFV